MSEFKDFIRSNMLTKRNTLYTKNIHKHWGDFECYRPKRKEDVVRFLYDTLYDIKEKPKCECGEHLKFESFVKGYNKCSAGIVCKVMIERRSKKLKATSFITKENLIFVPDDYVDNFIRLGEKYKGYINKYHYIKLVGNALNECSCEETLINIENLIIKKYIDNTMNRKDSSSLDYYTTLYGDDIGTKIFHNKSKASVSNGIEYYRNLYNDEEVAQEKLRERVLKTTNSYEAFLYRNNNNEQKALMEYQDYWKNTNFSVDYAAFVRRHGEKEGTKRYIKFCENAGDWASGKKWDNYDDYRKMVEKRSERIRETSDTINKDHTSLKSFVERYRKDGITYYNNYIDQKKQSTPNCKEYWLKEGYNLRDSLQFASDYNEGNFKNSKRAGRASSKESLIIFNEIIEWVKENRLSSVIHVGDNGNKEFRLFDTKLGKVYFYDLTFEDIGVIVEYDGCHVHTDIHKIINRDISNLSFVKTLKDARRLLYNDKRKEQVAKNNGFYLIRVSSKTKPKDNIKFIKKEIHEIIQNR